MDLYSKMKNHIASVALSITFLLIGCTEESQDKKIKFGTSADYPPFEYYEGGKIKGFEIDLAQLIAKELGDEAIFENKQFSTILAALQNGSVDAAISTITITDERKKNFDFSESYYRESLTMVSQKDKPITKINNRTKKKIACQLGTTMEIWLKKTVPDAEILSMDNNNQAIEALKAGHVDGVLIDSAQGKVFTQKNPGLFSSIIAQSDMGYGIAVKKGSPLKDKINAALKTLQDRGELQKLQQKWLGNDQWKN